MVLHYVDTHNITYFLEKTKLWKRFRLSTKVVQFKGWLAKDLVVYSYVTAAATLLEGWKAKKEN